MLIVWHSCLFDAHQVSVLVNIYLSLRLSNYVLISNPMILHTQVAVIYFHDEFTRLKGAGLFIIMLGVSLFNWYK